jgi:choline dehydrogenase-like flavoprotein
VRRFQEEPFLLQRSPGVTPDLIGFASTPAYRERAHGLGWSVMAFVYPRDWDDYRESRRTPVARSEVTDPATWTSKRMVRLTYVVEKSPNPDSRVTLSEERDALGLRKVAVDLRTRPEDWANLKQTARHLGLVVARTGLGRLRIFDLEDHGWCFGAGGHQTGTTRMADDPKKGVTDRSGRVHGLANLYCAGSSLYPTGGWEHPTFTIVALALRLADHLADGAGPM